jgi:hypothetical protein
VFKIKEAINRVLLAVFVIALLTASGCQQVPYSGLAGENLPGNSTYTKGNPKGNSSDPAPSVSCSSDSDCVPAQCCHPTACINSASKKPCNLLCTQVCLPNTLDGGGNCVCREGKCAPVYGNCGGLPK